MIINICNKKKVWWSKLSGKCDLFTLSISELFPFLMYRLQSIFCFTQKIVQVTFFSLAHLFYILNTHTFQSNTQLLF